jgi:capsular polysaccharide transport system ATP-binding protein
VSVVIENVRMPAGFPGAKRPLFDGLSMRMEEGSRVGVLGGRKSGKTTLLRLICGTVKPAEGLVRCSSSVSWPIPLSSFFMASLTVARNIRFIARLYGIDDEEFPRRTAELVELTDFLNTPLARCPKFVKPRLAFALGISVDFDLYLFDGSFAPGDKEFKQKAAEISAARMAGRAYIVATSIPAEVERNCESAYVLEAGRATYFAQMNEAVEHFKELLAAESQKKQAAGAEKGDEDDEEEGLGDVDVIGAAVADAFD